MNINPFTPMMQNGSSALSRALGDPAVGKIARRLRIDLQDPATLDGLLAMARQCVDGSWGDAVASKSMPAQASHLGQSRYERDAIRAYQEIAAMASSGI
jgi:hypothetical protein